MITVRDIAEHCNVSPGTVSNILNGRTNVGEQTRKRVLQYVHETGYRRNYFAQSIRNCGVGNRIISIITEGLGVFGTSQIVESIMTWCDKNDYRSMLMNMGLYVKHGDTWFNDGEVLQNAINPIIQEARAVRVSGIIYVAGHHRVIDCFPPDFPIPTVIAYGLSKDCKYPSIVIDDEMAGYNTAKYLTLKGHSRIGVIAGKKDNHHTIYRLRGYNNALLEQGISSRLQQVYYGDWRRPSGYIGAGELINKGVTAIFCLNDEMAAGVYDFCFEKGLTVGKDISIIGFDNMELSDYLRPHLTTNEIPLYEIGEKAAEVMLNLPETITSGSRVAVYKIPCKIIERESVTNI